MKDVAQDRHQLTCGRRNDAKCEVAAVSLSGSCVWVWQ